jgi:predicted small lipoprotein YifL
MLRSLAAALTLVALVGCGHRTAAAVPPASQNGATLGAYVMDAAPASPAPPAQVPPVAGQAPQPAGQAPPSTGQAAASACSQGQDAYRVLVFLVSSDTGLSVGTIAADLQRGQSLADVAGSRTGLVEQQSLGLVQAWLQFAEANGRVTATQAAFSRTVAQGVIAGLMTANVASCVPAMG